VRLAGGDGVTIDLTVAGYQFPDIGRPGTDHGNYDYDANWLVIEGLVNDGRRQWSFRDPCLLTTEAAELARWLEAAANGSVDLEATNFTEPNLEFRRVSTPTERPVIRITFRLEARPPWARITGDADTDWDASWLDVGLSVGSLRKAAQGLRIDLEPFPERRR
jgi:hypothetical protein